MAPIQLTSFSRPSSPWELRRREILSPPPERVWKALTDPVELRCWWCDGAEVDARPGGKYAFHGKTVYRGGEERGPSACDGAGGVEIQEWAPPERLAFHWRLLGLDTVVRYELASHLEQTALVVTQTAARPASEPDANRPPSRWEAASRGANWWSVALPALRTYVEEGKPSLRLDYPSLRNAAEIRLALGATTFPWVIWHKLTAPGELKRWWGSAPKVELKAGGAFRLEPGPPGPEKILELEPGRRLVHDWRWKGSAVSTIEWRIEETDGDTVIELTDHGPWDPGADRDQLVFHWASVILDLEQFSERGSTPREYQDG
jgi:uncharacterized protein YndB with AHSA1/START domain